MSDIFFLSFLLFFFFNDTATTEIYTLSLHDALPISLRADLPRAPHPHRRDPHEGRSEEHTSELQSRRDLVCRLLLEKKKKQKIYMINKKKEKNVKTKKINNNLK